MSHLKQAPRLDSLPRQYKRLGRYRFSRHLLCSGMVLKAVGLAAKLKDMGMIGQPVNEGGGQPGITKDLRPVGKSEVGGDQDSV